MTKNLLNDLFISKMQILMNFAVATEKSSFIEIEQAIGLK
jgi:hypothetical protein